MDGEERLHSFESAVIPTEPNNLDSSRLYDYSLPTRGVDPGNPGLKCS